MSQSGEKGKVSKGQRFPHFTVYTKLWQIFSGKLSNKELVIKDHGICNLLYTHLHKHPERISCLNARVSRLGFIACSNFSAMCIIIINLSLIHLTFTHALHKRKGRDMFRGWRKRAEKCHVTLKIYYLLNAKQHLFLVYNFHNFQFLI